MSEVSEVEEAIGVEVPIPPPMVVTAPIPVSPFPVTIPPVPILKGWFIIYNNNVYICTCIQVINKTFH